ncbi:structural maintenance of chromosomes protein 6-like, partial [Amphibalanus amphitrite]
MPKVVPKVVRRSTSSDSGAPARKRSRSSYDEPKETLPQGPGFLRSITLKNFMCHEHLNFKLNERINFIKGQNGSGKSAVLTAVMVGLGARAATTDRGSNIKGLIRTGQKSAVISLTLDNSGYDAFSPEKYGGHITIERSLKDSGGSTYRISSEKAPSQYAYRSRHSTEDALIDAVEWMTRHVDDGDVVAVTSIDLSRAFDSVDHDVLLRKLC